MNSNEYKLYIKIVTLEVMYNFVVEFFELKLFKVPKFNFKFQNI
jgi:hypothetical protein